MTQILALQIDPLDSLSLKTDSSLFLAYEAQCRGYRIFCYSPENFFYENGDFIAVGEEITLEDKGRTIQSREKKVMDLKKVNLLLIRQDPPVNMRYFTNLYLLELLEKHVTILNKPQGIRDACEKILPLQFSEFTPPTCFTESLEAALDFLKKHQKIVMKPVYGYGGHDVILCTWDQKDVFEGHFLKYIQQFQTPLILQRFIDDVVLGDKRIIFVNGKPISIFKRVPDTGDFRANLVQGGKAEACEFTDHDLKICHEVGPVLQKKGLYLAGIDILADYLIEINVTSPTGLRAAEHLYSMNIPQIFFDGLFDKTT